MGTEFVDLGKIYLRGIKKEDYTEGLYNWANDDGVTHYMVTGLNPSIKESMEKLYNDIK